MERRACTSYQFVQDEEKLIVIHQRHENFELTPSKHDVFNSNRWFFGQVAFIRNEDDQITGCTVNSGRVRGLFFQKMNMNSEGGP